MLQEQIITHSNKSSDINNKSWNQYHGYRNKLLDQKWISPYSASIFWHRKVTGKKYINSGVMLDFIPNSQMHNHKKMYKKQCQAMIFRHWVWKGWKVCFSSGHSLLSKNFYLCKILGKFLYCKKSIVRSKDTCSDCFGHIILHTSKISLHQAFDGAF